MGLLILRSSIVPDTTPNQFTFTDQNGVALSSTITSAAVTIAGLGAGQSAAVTASGGTADINASGTFSTSPGSVQNGDTVRARVTSSASNDTGVTATVTIGGVSDAFTATTESAGGLSPTPESTGFTAKIIDTSAAGDQSTQGGDVTNVAQYKAKYAPYGIYASNGVIAGNPQYEIASEVLTTGDVGSGIKARRTNYTASTQEHGNVIGWENDSYAIVPPGTGWYTTGKFWIPADFAFISGGNPHWKAFMWNRSESGGGSGRLYLMFYSNDYMAIKIDGTNFTRAFSTPGLGGNSPFSLRDREVQWTTYLYPPTNTVRMWIKAVGVTGGEAECTLTPGEQADGGGMLPAVGVGAYQENVTMYTDGASGRYLYTWGHRMWW